jgi:hypothetical protein
MTLSCSNCTLVIPGRAVVHLVGVHSMCGTCFRRSRHAGKALIERACTVCARRMALTQDDNRKQCSPSCRSSAFGLGAARR